MSNRYVWARNNIDTNIEDYGTGVYLSVPDQTTLGYSSDPSAFYWDWSDSQTEAIDIYSWDNSRTTNFELGKEGDSHTIPAGMLCNLNARYVYQMDEPVTVTVLEVFSDGRRRVQYQGSNKRIAVRRTKGTANGTVSNSASSTYPPRDYPSKSARIWPYSAPGT